MRVEEGNIDAFCTKYVLEGDRMKAKSIIYKERPQTVAKEEPKV